MQPKTSAEIGGMGHSVKRKEDPRFIRGQGNYVDDVVLPDMLYLDIVRSPYAHATIKSIDTSKALAIPGVLAVITGKDLAQYNLHWMPTLMSDTQMVLPELCGLLLELFPVQQGCIPALFQRGRHQSLRGINLQITSLGQSGFVLSTFKPHLPLASDRTITRFQLFQSCQSQFQLCWFECS